MSMQPHQDGCFLPGFSVLTLYLSLSLSLFLHVFWGGFRVFAEDKNPCHLPEAEGPCRGLVTRYFFDSSSQQCKRFYYGGCFGNANNFRSMAECQAKCHQQGASRRRRCYGTDVASQS